MSNDDEFGFDDGDDFKSLFKKRNAKTLPDYQNFRNVLFQCSQQLNRAVINYKFNKRKAYWSQAVQDYMNVYYQLREKNRLQHLTPKQRSYLKYFYNHTEKINLKVLMKLNLLVLKIMNTYGVYDISKQDEMYR